MQKILAVQPDNLAALLELSRIAAKRGDARFVKSAVGKVSARSSTWPPEVQHQLDRGAGGDFRQRSARGRDANHFPAQRADARSGLPSQSSGDQGRSR